MREHLGLDWVNHYGPDIESIAESNVGMQSELDLSNFLCTWILFQAFDMKRCTKAWWEEACHVVLYDTERPN